VPSYTRDFSFAVLPGRQPELWDDRYQRVTVNEAREIAKFLTRHIRKAKLVAVRGTFARLIGQAQTARPRSVIIQDICITAVPLIKLGFFDADF
jgi:hypothetical protein